MTRNGKIARLPLAIREELNQRLQNGEQGQDLVQWLNSLSQVKACLKAKFDGKPISENNISAWKTGGYQAWEQNQATQDGLDLFLQKAGGLKEATKAELTDHMAHFIAAQMALEFNGLDSLPEGEEKSQARRELLDSMLLLRRAELLRGKLRLEEQKFREQQEKERVSKEANRPRTLAEKEARVNAIMGID
jgi:hypothetical protein